jgi:FAD/FMN-containing dehydrogenase
MARTARATLDPAVIKKLDEALHGEIVMPENDRYDAARSVYNAAIDRYPSVVAYCTGAADIFACIRFAQENDIVAAVRCGGHSIAGNSVCDDGIVIDLSQMNGIRIDPRNRRVAAQGGTKWGALDHETDAFGLATVGGVYSKTGIGGLTLGGGVGWLMRKHGLTCDNLLGVDMITADCELIRADPEENADLFWAMRGAGHNFGVVTTFEYRLFELRSQLLAGGVFFHGERRREAIEFYREWARTEPDEITSFLVFLNVPYSPHFADELHGQPAVGIAACHTGTIKEAEAALRPLRDWAEPILDTIQPTRYPVLQQMSDPEWPPGLRHHWKSIFLNDSDSLADVILDYCGRYEAPRLGVDAADDVSPQPINYFEIGHMGGAVGRVGGNDTAFNHRDATYLANLTPVWTHPDDSERMVDWARSFWNSLEPFSPGVGYVNYFTDEGEDRVRLAYGPQKYHRLAALKATYDPSNFFRLNPNIRPNEDA